MKNLLMAAVITTALISCAKEKFTDDASASASSVSVARGGIEDKNVTPPQAVLNAFKSQFGNVPVRQWKLRSDGTYRAHFTNNGVLWEATYKADGTLVKSERA
jgi:hypothetical protein